MTSDERREVAARLSDAKRKCEQRGYPWMTDDLILAIGYEHDYEADNGIFDRLADLIDPTCHIADDDWASQQCMGPMLSCDRCGNAFPGINGPYQYCPCCGARVVSGDE
jgi:hypothetical protein